MDARISEVTITLDGRWQNNLSGALRILRKHGLEVLRADDDRSVVDGLIDATRLHALEKLDCVEYVRTVFTYFADYPPGDPRDRDAS
jgi:hypothetical protein